VTPCGLISFDDTRTAPFGAIDESWGILTTQYPGHRLRPAAKWIGILYLYTWQGKGTDRGDDCGLVRTDHRWWREEVGYAVTAASIR
jgi:hypothetical protein